MASTQKLIAEGILVSKETPNAHQQVIRVTNDRDRPISITIDITGSTGVTIEQSPGSPTFSLVIPSKQTLELATLSLEANWHIEAKYRISLKPVDSEAFMKLLADEKRRLDAAAQTCRSLILTNSISTLTPSLLQSKGLDCFVDPFFPPSSESIFKGAEQIKLDVVVHWRRPTQFFTGPYDVFLEEIEPNDIKQGQLGDCWLECAISSLAERPQLVRRLFLTPQCSEEGIYRLRICKDGEWREVTIDDYFPCFPNDKPIFSRSHGNELWVMLLEKAYAKLVGSYMRLRGGWAHEGMSDLTGCPTTTYEFETTADKEFLWRKILAMDVKGALIAAATPGQDMWTEARRPEHEGGLVPGHAYTVISAKEVLGNRLLNIRNPWGQFEWSGDWSDRSAKWTEAMKAALNPILDENDGTFWMNYADFLKYFVNVSFCYTEPFYEARLKGKFIRVQTTDGRSFCLSKFYYCLRITEKTRLFLGLHQDDKRNIGVFTRRRPLDLSLIVFKRDAARTPQLYHYEPMKIERMLEVELNLDPGEYIVVPKTSGCALSRPLDARPEGKTLLENQHLSMLAESTFRDIFRKFDLMVSQDLNNEELQAIFETGGVSSTDFQQFRQEKPLQIEGFLDLMEKLTIQKGENFMFGFLERHGYDRDLYSVKSRVFMLTIHSERQVELEVRDNIRSNLTNIGLVEHIKRNGEVKFQNDMGMFYALREQDYDGTIGTYMVVNKQQRQIKVTVDVTGCQNTVVSTLTDVNAMTLEAEGAGVLLHFQLLANSSFKPSIVITPA